MTVLRRVTAVMLLVPLTAPCAAARPAASPAARQAEERSKERAEERAERELAERIDSLEEEYRAKKAEVLRRFVSQLTAAKNDAIRGRDLAGAQRIFDRISDVVNVTGTDVSVTAENNHGRPS